MQTVLVTNQKLCLKASPKLFLNEGLKACSGFPPHFMQGNSPCNNICIFLIIEYYLPARTLCTNLRVVWAFSTSFLHKLNTSRVSSLICGGEVDLTHFMIHCSIFLHSSPENSNSNIDDMVLSVVVKAPLERIDQRAHMGWRSPQVKKHQLEFEHSTLLILLAWQNLKHLVVSCHPVIDTVRSASGPPTGNEFFYKIMHEFIKDLLLRPMNLGLISV